MAIDSGTSGAVQTKPGDAYPTLKLDDINESWIKSEVEGKGRKRFLIDSRSVLKFAPDLKKLDFLELEGVAVPSEKDVRDYEASQFVVDQGGVGPSYRNFLGKKKRVIIEFNGETEPGGKAYGRILSEDGSLDMNYVMLKNGIAKYDKYKPPTDPELVKEYSKAASDIEKLAKSAKKRFEDAEKEIQKGVYNGPNLTSLTDNEMNAYLLHYTLKKDPVEENKRKRELAQIEADIKAHVEVLKEETAKQPVTPEPTIQGSTIQPPKQPKEPPSNIPRETSKEIRPVVVVPSQRIKEAPTKGDVNLTLVSTETVDTTGTIKVGKSEEKIEQKVEEKPPIDNSDETLQAVKEQIKESGDKSLASLSDKQLLYFIFMSSIGSYLLIPVELKKIFDKLPSRPKIYLPSDHNPPKEVIRLDTVVDGKPIPPGVIQSEGLVVGTHINNPNAISKEWLKTNITKPIVYTMNFKDAIRQGSKQYDGDTFYFHTGGGGIRFMGIDAPESKQTSNDGTPIGTLATEAAIKLMSEGTGNIKIEFTGVVDKYGRAIARIINEKGVDVNEALIRQGYAKYYKHFPPSDPVLRSRYAAASQVAEGLVNAETKNQYWQLYENSKEASEYRQSNKDSDKTNVFYPVIPDAKYPMPEYLYKDEGKSSLVRYGLFEARLKGISIDDLTIYLRSGRLPEGWYATPNKSVGSLKVSLDDKDYKIPFSSRLYEPFGELKTSSGSMDGSTAGTYWVDRRLTDEEIEEIRLTGKLPPGISMDKTESDKEVLLQGKVLDYIPPNSEEGALDLGTLQATIEGDIYKSTLRETIPDKITRQHLARAYDHYYTAADCRIFLKGPSGESVNMDIIAGIGYNYEVSSIPVYTIGSSVPAFFTRGNSLGSGNIIIPFVNNMYMKRMLQFIFGESPVSGKIHNDGNPSQMSDQEFMESVDYIPDPRDGTGSNNIASIATMFDIEIYLNNTNAFYADTHTKIITLQDCKLVSESMQVMSTQDSTLYHSYRFMFKSIL